MKKIETIIRPEQFPRLRKKLEEVDINGLTVSEVAGCGQQRGQQALFRGTSYEIKLLPKVKVEMVIESESIDEIIQIIESTCSTNTVGDGKIFVLPIENAVRIRTGESGKEAIV
ncbi:MAG: P-II family nitrogen regulator [Bacillus sp. (in: Bacteria)]|uniref:P-II family nitrogen regulator n=1 Tax=Bacillus TaxID=1386 RepID=UPI00102DDFEF|nr:MULTISPECIES: P-II family nitrogen regulator [Bacillus]MBL7476853.1 P-II family nitrogen regulator [Bacillus paralicheniformis]MBW4886249.1 P-II family nitrogen regulator [Bacillus sp. (in: firmicutes)]MBX9434904.1 P-II family nitrogen regulator [Bacillus paralicheniformis]MCW4365174.1 P-II family nitrogen regulator [Bacillus paralicheniformis]MED1712874.1 P-II family nitrogen regulator [Bacillus paralicheniformis]